MEVLGIVPTMYRTASAEHKYNLKALREHYGNQVWEPIAERTLWAESLAGASNYVPVYAHQPSSPAAKEAWQFIDHVLRQIEGMPQYEPAT